MSKKKELLETFDKLREAMLDNNVEILSELITDEYIGFGPAEERQDKKLSLEAYQPGVVMLDNYEVEGVEARVVGEIGIITGKGCLAGRFAGSDFEDSLRFMDIYIIREGGWQLYMSQVTPLRSF